MDWIFKSGFINLYEVKSQKKKKEKIFWNSNKRKNMTIKTPKIIQKKSLKTSKIVLILFNLITVSISLSLKNFSYYHGADISLAKSKTSVTQFLALVTETGEFETEITNFLTHIPIEDSTSKYKIKVQVLQRGASLIMVGVTQTLKMNVVLDNSDSLIISANELDVEGATFREEYHVVEKTFSGEG